MTGRSCPIDLISESISKALGRNKLTNKILQENKMKTNFKYFLSLLFMLTAVLPVFALFPGNCLKFEAGDYVQGTGIPASFSGGFTIEGWVNHSSLSPNIQRYFTVLGETMVLRLDEGRLDFYIHTATGVQYRIRPETQLVVGQWYHVAGTYDGTTMKLYKNGGLVGSLATSGGMYATGATFNIGNSGEPMIGKIDELRLWNVARTGAEIILYRNQELTLPQTGLHSYWRFNESSGTAAADLCANSPGTLYNMTNANWVTSTIPHGGESGTISTNTTWSASTIAVINDVIVDNGVTLTINPGVTVKIAPGKKLIIKGNLIAEGTVNNRITFTESSPGAGWGGFNFDGTWAVPNTNSNLEYCIVEHGHDGANGRNFRVYRYPLLDLENCIIRDGDCSGNGGALLADLSSVSMINCLLNNNHADQGGALAIWPGSVLKMLNCTIVDNSANSKGAFVYYLNSSDIQPVIRNCIFWNNGSSAIGSFANATVLTDVQYCNIEGGFTGTGNINIDPGFTNETGNPYNISDTSQCIEGGINATAGLSLPACDLKGNPRIFTHPTNNRVDMGAYEYQGYVAPITLRASDGDDNYPGYVQLLWDLFWSYIPAPNEFSILRNGVNLGTVSGQIHSYQDYNVVPGTIYTYKVLANYGTETLSSLEDCGYIKPNGIISGRVQTTNNNPVVGVKLSLSPAVGKCLQFNAANASSISIANPGVNLNQDFTVELWVKTMNTTANLLDCGNHHLKIAGGKVVYTDGVNTLTQQNLSVAVNDSTWHHIAVVNNVATNTVEMYLDSYKVAVATGYYFAHYNFGNFAVPSGFTGFMDDIRLWAAVRDSSQVVDAMNMVMPSDSPGLQGYWAMNEGAGTMLFDGTNYAHNALASNCSWSSADAGMALGALTNVWGDYVISQIPYGSSTTFTVTPAKPGHIFQPETRTVTLSSSNIAANNVDFTDNSMIPISGKVKFAGTTIPVVDASIWLNGAQALPPVLTDATGYYVLEVEHGTSCVVSVVFNDHVFNGNGELGAVTFPATNVNFTDTFQTQLCVQVVGGSQNFPIGNFKITAKPVNDSYVYEQNFNADNTANWSSGQVVVYNLPPLNYNITISPFSGLINDPFELQVDPSFTKNKSIDLRNADAQGDTLRFEWRAPLEAEVAWADSLELKYMQGDSLQKYGFYVMQQNVWQQAVLRAVENYNYGVYTDHIISLTNCDIEITDDVGPIPTSSTSFNGASSFTYSFAPYIPNITSGTTRSYQKSLEFTVSDPETERSATNATWILTEGACPQGSSFSSTSPEIPILILHDPPGDGSYASFDQSSSHSYDMSFSYSDSEGSSTQAKVSLGVDITFDVGILFSVQTELDFVADLGYGYSTSSTMTSDTSTTTTLTTTQAYQTSSEDMLIGQASDLYVGGALNIAWGKVMNITWNNVSSSVDTLTTLLVNPQGFDTWYIYTENQILNTVIPNLDAIHDTKSADRWRSFVAANTQNIENAEANANHPGNISWNAGAGYLFSETNATETATTYSYETTVDETFWGEIGAFVNGLGGTASHSFETSVTIGRSATTTNLSETTISYVLADDDETSDLNELADYYSVDIKKDPLYGTPVFSVVGGASSKPWEPNTMARDGVSFMANTNASHGLLEGQQAVFLLNLGNTSQSNEERRYYLCMHHESNPGGATILINGLPLIDRMAFDIGGLSSVQAVMSVIQGPIAYDYSGLKLEFYAEGDRGNEGPDGHYFYQSQLFNVSWETPYSKVSIASPGADWQINQASDNQMEIMLTNYDLTKAKFHSLILEYKRPSSVDWSRGFEVLHSVLLTHPRYYTSSWDVESLADGVYQIRAGAVDSLHATYYTEAITGFIDRCSPTVWGLPQPSDGLLQLGDVISLTFTEDIDPNSIASAAILLGILRTNMDVGVNVQVNGSSVSFVPTIANYWLENETLVMSVSGLKDLCGNPMTGLPVEWEFYVNANPVAWLQPQLEIIKPLGQTMQITTYLNNSGGQTSSFSLTNLPDWLTVNTDSGILLPMDSQCLVFNISNQLGYGTFRDTVYAEIPGLGREALLFEISVLANPPAWATTQLDNFEYSMTITGQLMMESEISTDTNDIIGAFVLDEGGDYICRGYTNLRSVPYIADAYQFFLTISSNEEDAEDLYFRIWDSSLNKEHYGTTEAYVFTSGAVYGTPLSPEILHVSPTLFRSIPCRSGWNWVSVNLQNPASMAVNDVLGSLAPADNDLVKNQTHFAQYTTGSGWVGNLNTIASTEMLKIKLSNPDELQIMGNLEPPLTTPINHGSGWNWIGYLPHVSISVNEALADMSALTTGDLIKNQTGYAQFIEGYGWFGSLLFMDAGQGYMLKTATAGSFTYPDYVIPREQTADFAIAQGTRLRELAGWNCNPLDYEYSSNITAEIHDLNSLLNDPNITIAAFYGEECRGIATPVQVVDQWVLFLTQYSNVLNQALTYKVFLSDSNEIVDLVETLPFVNNQTLGNPLEPYPFYINMGELSVPQNLALIIEGNSLSLTWDAVRGAKSYKVYAGDSPEGEFTEVSSLGTFSGTIATRTGSATLSDLTSYRDARLMWSCNIPQGPRKFYYIKANTDPR